MANNRMYLTCRRRKYVAVAISGELRERNVDV